MLLDDQDKEKYPDSRMTPASIKLILKWQLTSMELERGKYIKFWSEVCGLGLYRRATPVVKGNRFLFLFLRIETYFTCERFLTEFGFTRMINLTKWDHGLEHSSFEMCDRPKPLSSTVNNELT